MSLPPNVRQGTLIGSGAFGEVYKTWWNFKPAAAKVLHKDLFESDVAGVNTFTKSCRLQKRLKHKNVVQVLDLIIYDSSPPVLLTELLDCDLRTFIGRHVPNRISFPDTMSIMLDVAEGLDYLHHQCNPPIIHRDISSTNILLSEEKQAKINDFGVATYEGKTIFATPVPGTPAYAAPETYPGYDGGQTEYSAKIDIFSFGVVLMEVINGIPPQLASYPFGRGLYYRILF